MRQSAVTKVLLGAVLTVLPLSMPQLHAAPQAASAQTDRVLGTVTAIEGTNITVRTGDAQGSTTTIALTPQTRLLRASPGQSSLKSATPMQPGELAVGDRVLIRLAEGGGPATASLLVAMKQADISQAHAQEEADWARNGIAGIADAVDPVSGTITLRAGRGGTGLVIHTTPDTQVRRYAADSTAFANSHPAKLTDVHAGDQIRARGVKDEGAGTFDAKEVVAGSFRNIAGTVASVDSGANSLTLKDLASKKSVVLYLDPETQLRKLPEQTAQRLAHRENRPGAGQHAQGAPASPARGGQENEAGLLQQAPAIELGALKKGDAVMVVASSPDAPKPTAITIVAGVEPLLEAPPEASANLFSASWNLGGNGGGNTGEEGAPQR